MGRAFSSISGEASSAFCNPGATALIDRSEFSAFHTSLFLGTNYDCLALAHPVGSVGVFTLSLGRLGTSSFVGRDEYNRPDKSISASESHTGLSYARPIWQGISGGLTFKGVGQEIGDNADYGFGLDLGLQYRPRLIRGLTVGFSATDLIQPSITLLDVQDKYQTVARAGLSYTRLFTRNFGTTVVLESEMISGRDSKFHPGIEAAFQENYFLRFGLDDDNPTFGAGLIYNFLKLDYAYENIDYFGASHRISLGFTFGKSARVEREEALAKAVKGERESWQKSLDQQRAAEYGIFLSKGDSLFSIGKYQDAIGFYERALAVDEGSAKARSMSDSAMGLIISGASATARDQKREALISNRTAQAIEHFKAGRLNDAISGYELLLEIDPGNKTITDLLQSTRETKRVEVENIRNNAQALRSRGDYSGALLEWNRLLNLEPQDAEAKQSIDVAKNQLKADALVSSAVALINQDKYSTAVTYLEQAQAIKPGDSSIKALLSDARAKSAPATSLTDIKASAEHWAVYLKGLESYQSGNYEGALSSWESLRQFYPNNTDLEKNIAQARQRYTTEGGKPQD